MANAWCINAISCDWCLIQTLQQLDSSNIWVWVQFTAPNPLDDKRLDYIKYTDKNWNTCCLSWENEILIYATNWTIKNLTLTNDDTNEVVNVKRNDIFWSNRKKTVVRYKTWWYPTSITDWTLAVEELVQNQYASTWYNVSWLSDWTTYYFSAFAVAQDDTIIDMQSKNITTDFFWWKYQKVEYIQSSWTQYIDSSYIITPNTEISADFQFTATTSQQMIFWIWQDNNTSSWINFNVYIWWSSVRSAWLSDWTSSNSWNNTSVSANTNRNKFVLNNWTFKIYNSSWTLINTTNTKTTISRNATHSFWIFARREMYYSNFRNLSRWKLYWFQVKESWTLVRDFIPAYRKSDSVIWLVDAVNKVFYTNAWSWTFTKWPNI